MARLQDLLDVLTLRGCVGAAELRTALGASAPTLSRLVALAGPNVVRFGKGRATRYGLLRNVGARSARLPVYRIDEGGAAAQVAVLSPIFHGTWVEDLTRGRGHLHAGLPPVVVDMTPAGYLGRRFAERHAGLELPPRLGDWNDDHRLLALARRGEDAPGDLILGVESLERHANGRPAEARDRDYPRLAELSAAGGAGSSAAGEQPKFAAQRAGRHFLVKFTLGDGTPSDSRWRDLLVCEELALDVLREAGVSASRARVVDAGARRFLEVERFDRIGKAGRRGVLTLGPLDDDLFGARDSWTDAAARLVSAKLLGAADARTIRLLEAYGIWIANGDRHFGNLAFFGDGLEERPRLALAPAYDMLPMQAAPHAGVVPPLPVTKPPLNAKLLDVWTEAAALAAVFWARVAKDPRVTAPFRRSAAQLARREA